MKSPRQIAVEILMQVETRGAWSHLALDNILNRYRLDARDCAFVSALFYGALERLVTLDACIAAHSKQPPEKLSPAVLAVLRAGVYQLLYMDGVPDSAAVNESVELVKHLRKAQAAGFVNGVLRSFLRAGKAVPIPESPLDARLGVLYSCPRPLVSLWLAGYGESATERILRESLGAPCVYLRTNTLRVSPEELQARLAAHGVQADLDPDLPECLVVTGAVQKLAEHRKGLFHVQDKASQLCAASLGVLPGMRVLDACAAPGGKSFTLMELMRGEGTLVATDLHEHRVRLIEKRAKQLGLKGITALTADMTAPRDDLGEFDRVLCDVPCSGFGAIRHKPEIKYKPLEETEKLPVIQYKILETASQYCKAGGLLLYSTCTLNPAENEQVSRRFRELYPEFVPEPLPEILGGAPERTLLGELGADGFYAALFRRLA